MSTGRIGLSFSINNFPVQSNFDVRVNVKEDFNYLRYGSSFGLRNVGVSYLDSEPINVNDNIIIRDLTASVPENSPLKFQETEYLSQTFDIPDADFLITDIYKTESTGSLTPLYYAHDLTSYTNISEVQILDGDFQPVNPDLYMYIDESATLGYASRNIYTNLRSSLDTENNEYTVYYVKFRNLDTNSFVTTLLNAAPFYERATFSTAANIRSYTVSPRFGLANININFDSRSFSPTGFTATHRFSLRVQADNRIRVERPSDLPASEKWYLRINPGEFYKNTISGDARYYVPEYDQQLFSPVRPYKLLVEKRARVVSKRMLYVEPKPIANLNQEGFYIYIVLRNKFNQTIRALTNDPNASVYATPNGVITDVFYEKDAIQSIAEEDGYIRLNTDIDTDASVYITYRYSESFYTYRGISVNSTINPDVLNNKVTVYVKPEFTSFDPSGNVTSESVLPKTVYHLLIDENDLILQSNETDDYSTFEGQADSGNINWLIDSALSDDDIYTGYEIEILSGDNSGRRLKISSYNTSTKQITVSENFQSLITPGTRYRINKRFMDYTFQDPISSTVFSYDGWKTTYLSAPYHHVLLADVFVIQTVSPSSIDTTDIRIRGGGIKSTNISDALNLQDQVQWYWDIGYWDGQPYPGMGAILVELPRSILKEVGGNFTRNQVREIVKRHMANGTYPVIRYYDSSTEIINVQPGNRKITVEWEDIEATSYNVYVGQNPDQLSLYRSVAGVITSLDVTELDNNKVYYIMVESVVGDIAQLPSRTAFAIPFNPADGLPPAIYGETIYGQGSYSDG